MTKRSGKVISLAVGILMLAGACESSLRKQSNEKLAIENKTKGWTLVYDVAEPKPRNIKKIKMVSYCSEVMCQINGQEIHTRALEMQANFGQNTANYLLVNQNEIPKEFEHNYLVFPGTIWRDSHGNLVVSSLRFFGDKWYLEFETLNKNWTDDGGRFVYFSTDYFTYDKTQVGWKLVENVTRPEVVNIKDLKLISFLRDGEFSIGGEEMRFRAIQLEGNFGQDVAEYLFARQDKIPKEFRKHVLVFPGTVWLDMYGGGRSVLCLHWSGVQWYLGLFWLDSNWDDRNRLLSTRKPK